MSILIDSRTEASNPGGLALNPLHYAKYYPLWPVALTIIVLAGLVLCLRSWHGLIVLLPAVVVAWLYWSLVRAHFRCGCVNPTRVISSNPFLLAVFTDLAIGSEPYPVIKIIRHPQSRLGAGSLTERLATVALYQGQMSAEHWEDFTPKLAECATDDAAAIRQITESIPEEEWAALESGLSQVPRPWKPGLYPIRVFERGTRS